MAVVRVNKTSDFTVMSNAHFKEREMSLKAKGLLSLMLSLPDEWDYSVRGLVTLSKDGIGSVMSSLSELEDFGYLERIRAHDEKGRFAGYDYNIFEHPIPKKTDTKEPYSENPNTEKPYTENPPQLNTNSLTTKEVKTNELNNILSEFEILWKIYPRKIGKPKALKAYQKARKNGVSFENVQRGINNYLADIKAKKTGVKYIKHGSTWFNGECWDDEYSAPPEKKEEMKRYGGTYIE
jgi:hypothetical protein